MKTEYLIIPLIAIVVIAIANIIKGRKAMNTYTEYSIQHEKADSIATYHGGYLSSNVNAATGYQAAITGNYKDTTGLYIEHWHEFKYGFADEVDMIGSKNVSISQVDTTAYYKLYKPGSSHNIHEYKGCPGHIVYSSNDNNQSVVYHLFPCL